MSVPAAHHRFSITPESRRRQQALDAMAEASAAVRNAAAKLEMLNLPYQDLNGQAAEMRRVALWMDDIRREVLE